MKSKRADSLADALFGKTKKAAIGLLFSRPERAMHLRDLARAAEVSPAMMGKELDVLVAVGIVIDERDGNRRVARANPDCPLFEELKGIARKTAGLLDAVRFAVDKLEGVESAFVFGSVARGEEKSSSDVDVCIVGGVRHKDALAALATAEGAIGREINLVVYDATELREKLTEGSGFVERLVSGEKMFLKGDEDGFQQIARGRREGGQRRRSAAFV